MAGSNESERTRNLSGIDGQESRGKSSQSSMIRKSGPVSALSLFLGILLVLGSCTSATNFSGATAPLPTGQTGSLVPLEAAPPGNCYIPDGTTACSSSTYQGAAGVTAVAAVTSGSTNTLFLGDKSGNIYDATVSSAAPTQAQCVSGGGSAILSLAVIPGTTTPGTVFFATLAGVFYEPYTSCSSTGSETKTTVTASSLLTYSGASTTPDGARWRAKERRSER